MKTVNSLRSGFCSSSAFRRDWLPSPIDYYQEQGIQLKGSGTWRSALCPFHKDTAPSLRIKIENGAFRCMSCGAHGGDVVSFHRQRYGLSFCEAAKQLRAWEAV